MSKATSLSGQTFSPMVNSASLQLLSVHPASRVSLTSLSAVSFEGQGGERVRILKRSKVNSLPFKVAKERLYNDPGCSEMW